MKKDAYIKPSFKILDISLNELCVGSECHKIDVTIPRGGKTDGTKIYIQGDLDHLWDDKF